MNNVIDIKALEKKWAPVLSPETSLNEGAGENIDFAVAPIKNKKIKRLTAVVLENQMNQLRADGFISESNTTDISFNKAGGYATNGEFHKIAIPMVRRTFPELIAHDLVGVQPLTGPVGIAFALRYKAAQIYTDMNGNPLGTGPNVELGYNYMDPSYTGTHLNPSGEGMPTAFGEGLGSVADPDINGQYPGIMKGLGIGEGKGIKEVNFTIEKQQVEAKTRKLRSRWSLEVAQDLKAMHGLDLEEEMMDILAYEITAEIDREIVNEIRLAANQNAKSNITGKLGNLDWSNAAHFDGRWEHEKYRNLFNLAIRKSNQIAIDTRRAAGNFIIASPTLCAAFEASSAFTIAPVANDVDTSTQGVAFIGVLDGRLKLYRDTFLTSDEFIVGYKGASAYDAGIIYLPYIQLLVSKAQMEDSYNPSMGLMSRYGIMGHMFGSSNYYVRCVIENMP